MSRRRKIEIKASELACFDTLVETLRTRPEFADFDPTSLHVWAYENYEPTIRNAARAIRHLIIGWRHIETKCFSRRIRAIDCSVKGFGRSSGNYTPDTRPVDCERLAGRMHRTRIFEWGTVLFGRRSP